MQGPSVMTASVPRVTKWAIWSGSLPNPCSVSQLSSLLPHREARQVQYERLGGTASNRF